MAIAFLAGSIASAQSSSGVLPFGGIQRDYLMHLPTGWDAVSPLPLLIGLHGGGGNNLSFAGPNRFIEAADRESFIAVFPNAVGGVWNDGRSIYPPELQAIDDVGFIAALIDEVTTNWPIAPDRIYATGMSNGGMLTHRLALEMGYTAMVIGLQAFRRSWLTCHSISCRPNRVCPYTDY